MRLAINLVLIALVAFLAYVLIDSIREPIVFKAEKEKREAYVIQKLSTIRTAQELYRGVTGEFAPNFDTLKQVLREGRFKIISVEGDPDDPSGENVVYDSTFVAAIDSVRALGIKLDSLEYIPFSNGEKFDINADTLTYQKTLVNVVEVGTPRNKFMGRFGDARFKRYEKSYDPFSLLKFGDMHKPTLTGNWE